MNLMQLLLETGSCLYRWISACVTFPLPMNPSGLARGCQFADDAECAAVAAAAGARPLSDYYGTDPELLADFDDATGNTKRTRRKPSRWHDPNEGLLSVRALLKHFGPQAETDPDNDDLEEIVNDLTAFEQILEQAVATNDAFRLEISA